MIARRAPTREARGRAVRAEAELARILGPKRALALAKTAAVQATAFAEAIRLATAGRARQPETQWTPFRLEPVSLVTRARRRVELTLATPLARDLLPTSGPAVPGRGEANFPTCPDRQKNTR